MSVLFQLQQSSGGHQASAHVPDQATEEGDPHAAAIQERGVTQPATPSSSES